MFLRNHGSQTIVAEIEALSAITNGLFKAIADHGGDIGTLNSLLEDVRGEQKLLRNIAKLIVSPLWAYTEQSVDLGPIDVEKPMEEFCDDYPNLIIARTLQETHSSYMSFRKPRAACTYRLVHLGAQRLLFDEMLDARLGEKVEHAGWRELVAYSARLNPSDFRNCRINAAGSQTHSKGPQGDREETIVPAIVENQGQLCMVWSGVKWRGRDRNFGPDAFYLVRVYE